MPGTSDDFSSPKKAFNANLAIFLEHAHANSMLEDGVAYLGFVAFAGNDKLFPTKKFPDHLKSDLKDKAISLGIVNENGEISESNRADLNDFIANKSNQFITNHKRENNADEIRAVFQTAFEPAIHEHAAQFGKNQSRELQNEAVAYLAVLALSDNLKRDIPKIIPGTDLVAKFNNDARELKLIAGDGILSKQVKETLPGFFTENNKASSIHREGIPVMKEIFNDVKAIIPQGRQKNDGIRIF